MHGTLSGCTASPLYDWTWIDNLSPADLCCRLTMLWVSELCNSCVCGIVYRVGRTLVGNNAHTYHTPQFNCKRIILQLKYHPQRINNFTLQSLRKLCNTTVLQTSKLKYSEHTKVNVCFVLI